jgi:chemotaxis protein methyltransferase CheR
VVEEWCKKNNRQVEYKITGTDISERILAKAKSAKYTQLEVQRGLSAPLMVKYFKKDESDQWTASADLTRHTEFKKLNLMDPFNFSENFDLILCRNVLIYQSVERKSAILKKIHAALAPGGFLILGSGESLIGLSEDFSQVSAEGAVFYRKKDAALEQTPEKVA